VPIDAAIVKAPHSAVPNAAASLSARGFNASCRKLRTLSELSDTPFSKRCYLAAAGWRYARVSGDLSVRRVSRTC
jgi:hypothetical protein